MPSSGLYADYNFLDDSDGEQCEEENSTMANIMQVIEVLLLILSSSSPSSLSSALFPLSYFNIISFIAISTIILIITLKVIMNIAIFTIDTLYLSEYAYAVCDSEYLHTWCV